MAISKFEFIIGGKPIFLHFLNRELLRSVGIDMPIDRVLYIIKMLLVCSTEQLYSSIAFLWEISDFQSKHFREIEKLASLGFIELISTTPSVDEFVHDCQCMYAYDHCRYPMYFESIPKSLLRINPSFIKDQSTTAFILSELTNLNLNLQPPTWNLLYRKDQLNISQGRSAIQKAISERNGEALTISYFNDKVDKFLETKFSLSRWLSLIYTKHSIDYLCADIATGIKGLYYYDNISTSYPILDLRLIEFTLRKLGINRGLLYSDKWIDFFIQIRCNDIHQAFVELFRYFLNGVMYVAKKKYVQEKVGTVNPVVEETLKRILSDAKYPLNYTTHKNNLIYSMYERLLFIVKFSKKIPVFEEFDKLWEMEIGMNDPKLLILTATDLETEVLVNVAKNHYNLRMNRSYIKDHTIYDFGNLSGCHVIAAQSEAGTESPGGMTLTATDVIDELRPEAVILAGIAFGLNKTEQTVGDVLVSKQIRLYDPKKVTVSEGDEVEISRGDKSQATTRMLDRCRSARLDWSEGTVHFGLLLSGNTLVNSERFINSLKSLEPEAIGGEMEGAGLYSVCVKRKVDWIVIKAIADWGHDKTDSHQKIAATNAMKFVLHVLSMGGLSKLSGPYTV